MDSSLEKKLLLCLVMAVLIVAYIPFYWIREPARQEAAIARIQSKGVQKGGEIYLSACGGCHGQQGQGGAGPSVKGLDAALVRKTTREGRGIMPAFSPAQVSDPDLDDMIAFLKSLK